MTLNILTFATLLCLSPFNWAKDDGKCEILGLQCSTDKKSIVTCKEIGQNPLTLITCQGNEKCKHEKNSILCEDPTRVELTFVCTAKGEFPDPVNCNQTYICEYADQKPKEVCECPSGYNVYPAPGLYCVSGDCPRNEIIRTEGAHGPLTFKNGEPTSYYYFCGKSNTVKVYHGYKGPNKKAMHKLWRGFRRDQGGKVCVPYEKPANDTTSTETPTTITPPTSTKPTETTTTPPTSTKPTETTTTPPTSTKPTETTTTPPTSTKPTETTTTPPISTKPTEPTTTESTSTKPTEITTPTPTTVPPEQKPTCKSKGELHPSECNCDYYKCNSNLKSVRQTCIDGLKYNETLKKCVFGVCDQSKCIYRPSYYIF